MDVGRNGLRLSVSRRFGPCADCGKKEKLIGYICKTCYGARDSYHRYRSDPKYREDQKKRNKRYQEKMKALVAKSHRKAI